MSEWKDDTSYSQGQRGKVPPSTWVLTVAGRRIVVTRRWGVDGTWFLLCDPWFRDHLDLRTDNLADAQDLALSMVDGEIRKLMNEWGQFWLTREKA